ncbi:MAG: phosphonopyruvate decarboxylase, partial [Rhodospirillales bacterium]|nr:phosphonopyruvate decarboxylase [Rhodospirillales bacterium]
MLGVTQECRFPLLTIVTMRGEWGEFNPWQAPMGQAVRPSLEAAGVIVQHIDDAKRIGEAVEAASHMAFDAMRAVAVLIGQRVIGAKDWRK